MQETQVWTLGQEDSLEEEMATHSRMLLLFSNVQLFFATPWTAARQASLSFTISNSCPLSRWCIRPSHPLSSPSPPALNLSQHLGLFQWVSSLYQLAKGLKLQLQHQSFQWIFSVDFLYDWLVWSPCCPRDSQESLAPQFKSIKALSLLYGSNFTSAQDYWENHSFDYKDLCWQSNVFAF